MVPWTTRVLHSSVKQRGGLREISSATDLDWVARKFPGLICDSDHLIIPLSPKNNYTCKMKVPDVCLRADEPLREGLLRVADSLIQKAMMRIGYPTRDHAKNVHFVRVTINDCARCCA